MCVCVCERERESVSLNVFVSALGSCETGCHKLLLYYKTNHMFSFSGGGKKEKGFSNMSFLSCSASRLYTFLFPRRKE